MSEIVGYIRYKRAGHWAWHDTTDRSELLDALEADPESVVVASDLDELKAELYRRYPDVSERYGQYNGGVLTSEEDPIFWSNAGYSGEDLPILRELVEKHKRVRLEPFTRDAEWFRENLDGVVVTGFGTDKPVLIYDPKRRGRIDRKRLAEEESNRAQQRRYNWSVYLNPHFVNLIKSIGGLVPPDADFRRQMVVAMSAFATDQAASCARFEVVLDFMMSKLKPEQYGPIVRHLVDDWLKYREIYEEEIAKVTLYDAGPAFLSVMGRLLESVGR